MLSMRMMERRKAGGYTACERTLCGILAALLILAAPLDAYAVSATVVQTVGGYVIGLILDACGIDLSLSSLTAAIGSWDTFEEYEEQGSSGELGAFSQWLYDKAHDEGLSDQVRAGYEEQVQALNRAVTSAWGGVVTGIKCLADAVKSWFLTLEVEVTDTGGGVLSYPSSAPSHSWTTDNYVTTVKYPVQYLTYGYTADVVKSQEYMFTSYEPTQWADTAKIANWYKPASVEVVGYFDREAQAVRFYKKDASAASGYSPYSMFYHFVYAKSDGTLRYSVGLSDYSTVGRVVCEERYVSSLPFPVYMAEPVDGALADVYEPGKAYLTADTVDTSMKDLAFKSVQDTITLPATAEEAAVLTGAVSDALGDQEALKSVLGQAGLVIDWYPAGTVEGDDTKDDADSQTLKSILDGILALPDAIKDKVSDLTQVDEEETRRRFTLSSSVADKFPFCIPFDFIHLIEKLEAEREPPKIPIPIKFDYEFFHYDHTFVVDFEEWDGAVTVLRVMLDLLFTVCLISATRGLIRG